MVKRMSPLLLAALIRRAAPDPPWRVVQLSKSTARPSAAEIASRNGAKVELVEDLREMNIGAAHGLRWADIAERWPEFARGYRDETRGMTVPWPDGESGMDLYARVARAIDQIDGRHLPTMQADPANEESLVAVVGHGGSLAWAFHHLLKKSPTTWPRYGIPNASISEFLVRSPDEPAELLRLNDVGHLQDLAGDPLRFHGRS